MLAFFSKPAVSYLRSWDKIAAQRPDAYVAISKEVQGRIKKYYGRESVVVYPPVNLVDGRRWKIEDSNLKIEDRRFYPQSSTLKNLPSTFYHPSSYFLIVSRLVPYKRIDIAIRAFNKLKLPLKIVGTGSDENKLKSIASPNIEFLGYLTERELVRYYRDCRALIFPGREDFGLTVLEAQGFGRSVIAFRGGGALETIIEGKTGEFFYPQTEEALVKKIKEFKSSKYDPMDCIKNAERFSYERFRREFMKEILRYAQNDRKKL
jgi:glycosyltransferase involved in cell wall biosynthesis